MSLSADEQLILHTVKNRWGGDVERFLKDAAQGIKARIKQREKIRRYRFRKDAEEAEEAYGPSKKVEEEPKKKEADTPPPPKPQQEEPQEEKPRRPSLLNLAELQATFQKQLQEGPVKIPPLITTTKSKTQSAPSQDGKAPTRQ